MAAKSAVPGVLSVGWDYSGLRKTIATKKHENLKKRTIFHGKSWYFFVFLVFFRGYDFN